jgi:hypothetical protein
MKRAKIKGIKALKTTVRMMDIRGSIRSQKVEQSERKWSFQTVYNLRPAASEFLVRVFPLPTIVHSSLRLELEYLIGWLYEEGSNSPSGSMNDEKGGERIMTLDERRRAALEFISKNCNRL